MFKKVKIDKMKKTDWYIEIINLFIICDQGNYNHRMNTSFQQIDVGLILPFQNLKKIIIGKKEKKNLQLFVK